MGDSAPGSRSQAMASERFDPTSRRWRPWPQRPSEPWPRSRRSVFQPACEVEKKRLQAGLLHQLRGLRQGAPAQRALRLLPPVLLAAGDVQPEYGHVHRGEAVVQPLEVGVGAEGGLADVAG